MQHELRRPCDFKQEDHERGAQRCCSERGFECNPALVLSFHTILAAVWKNLAVQIDF